MKFKYTFEKILDNNNLEGELALIFDRLTGKYIKSVFTPVPDLRLDHPSYAVFFETYCINTHEVVGGIKFNENGEPIKDYEIVEKEVPPMEISEKDFDELIAFNITKEYKLSKQLNLIAEAVIKIAEESKVKCKEIDDLQEMVDFIKDYKLEGEKYRDTFLKTRNAKLINVTILDKHNKGDDLQGIVF